MDIKYLIVVIISIILFLVSFDFKTFNGYSFLGMILLGIFLFFGSEYIFYLLKSGKSMIFIIGMIIILLIIGIFSYSGYYIYTNKKEIDKKWPQYKCKPYILPFAGWAIGPNGISGSQNFIDCMWSINKSFFDILISPFTEILQLITNILSGITNDIQNIRKMITYMRNNMEDMAKDIMNKIWDSYERIAYLFKTFLKVFSKLGDLFKDLFDVLIYAFYTLASLWNGPIGGVANFFCFDENTLIDLNDKNSKKIKDIQVGDILKNNNQVLGVLMLNGKNTQLYNYYDIIVSADHYVFDIKENKWTKIKNTKDGKKIKKKVDKLYCLITENGMITSQNIVFKDYFEIKNRKIKNRIYQLIHLSLTGKNKKINENVELYSGLGKDTKIKMKYGDIKKIKDIKINDETKYGKVLGICCLKIDDKYLFQENILSKNCYYLDNMEWKLIDDEKEIDNKKIDDKELMYHIIVENNVIELENGMEVRDFEYETEKKLDKKIENMIENSINQ